MSDLISRAEVMNIIQEELSLRCGHDADIALFSVKKKVSELPTAFDTEKVVEEIKKLDLDGVSMVEDGKYTLVRRNEVISLIQTNNACIDELLKGEEG